MGGKSRLTSTLIPRLPKHTTYVEPFCGGCAVFWSKPRSRAEVLNDRDARLQNLLRIFQRHPDALLREMESFTHSRILFNEFLTQPGLTDIERAARFYFILKASFGSRVDAAPTFGYAITTPTNNTLASVEETVREARKRLAGVTLENLDFADVIPRYDSPDTLFYCDPPYIDTAGYAEAFSADDHARLELTLAKIEGKAIVSLNDCEAVREIYTGWHIEECETTYSVARGSPSTASEVIISREPLPDSRDGGLFD